MIKKLYRNLFVFTAIILSTVTCAQGSGVSPYQGAPPASHRTQIVIGFSMDSLLEERWQKDRDLFVAAAERRGAEVSVQAANGDDEKQIFQAESMISQGVDVLVIVPHDSEKMAAVVRKAHEAGIKVISYDRLIKNADVDLYVSFDNERVGELQAEAVAKIMPRGDYAYIGGAKTDYNAYLLRKGAFRVLQPLIDRGDIRLIADEYTDDWSPAAAMINMKRILDKNGKIDAVVAANDGTAGGVIQALVERGLDGKVPVSGQDAELAAIRRVVKGTQSMTVYKPLRELAEKSAEFAVQMALYGIVSTNQTVRSGERDVPAVLLEPVAVDKTNLETTVVADGFHKKRDIYP